MPDNRHLVMSLNDSPQSSAQLWLGDVVSGSYHALTSGTTSRDYPAASPDGSKIVFVESMSNFDVVSVDLATAAGHRLIATSRNEAMPAWAARQPLLVYITDRNGQDEIWLHGPGNAERPLVTARNFPAGLTHWFMGPTLSPEGDRAIYTLVGRDGNTRLWISAVAGGAPVRLTDTSSAVAEFPGSWSPDGNWFAYFSYGNGKDSLMKVKTAGQSTPELLKKDPDGGVPVWSPSGEWIADGKDLISADGKTSRSVGEHHAETWAFSADGRLLYIMRADHDRELLFSVDVATGTEKVIGDAGKDFRPGSYLNPAIRFSLTPDGKSITYGSGTSQSNLWLLEGFAPRRSLFP